MTNDEYNDRLEKIVKSARPNGHQRVLFNYFRKEAIEYLIGPNADISCTNCGCLLGQMEIVVCANMFTEWLKNRYLPQQIDVIRKKINWLIWINEKFYPAMPYIFCLTEEEDNPCFWCKFAPDGGYSVGLDREKLTECCKAIVKRETESNATLQRVMYLMPALYKESNKCEIESLFQLLYEQYFTNFDPCVDDENSKKALSSMLFAASIIKDEKFAFEREWRLVIWPTRADVPEATQSVKNAIDAGVQDPKARLKTGIFKECAKDLSDIIRCVWISPQGDKDVLQPKLQKQLGALMSPKSGGETCNDNLPFIRCSTLDVNKVEKCRTLRLRQCGLI